MKKDDAIDMDKGLLSIGTVAKTLEVHQRTLRIWDEQKILTPSRSEGDRRLYSLNDVETGRFILFLTRNLALNLTGVKIIFAMLKENKVSAKNRMNYIQKIAKKANIDLEIQQVNIKKTCNKGRKKSN